METHRTQIPDLVLLHPIKVGKDRIPETGIMRIPRILALMLHRGLRVRHHTLNLHNRKHTDQAKLLGQLPAGKIKIPNLRLLPDRQVVGQPDWSLNIPKQRPTFRTTLVRILRLGTNPGLILALRLCSAVASQETRPEKARIVVRRSVVLPPRASAEIIAYMTISPEIPGPEMSGMVHVPFCMGIATLIVMRGPPA